MAVPFLDLRVHDPQERQSLLDAMDRVLQHGRLINGPEVEQLESEVAGRLGRRFAVGVGSGTDALVMALTALSIGPGDEVITTPLSFMATTNAILAVGATPVFADLGDDLTLDPATLEALITPRTRAILPVHWAGKICRMGEILAIATRHGLPVLEDCAQAFGATRRGKAAGSFGRLACFSMNTMKVFASLGEAGMVVTDDESLAQRLRLLRYHGFIDRERSVAVSQNYRMDTLQAAVLLERLRRVDAVVECRRANAAYYLERLAEVVGMFPDHPDCRDAYYTFTIATPQRDDLRAFLQSRGIESSIQHRYLCPQQSVFAAGWRGVCPNAERLVKQVLCLPANEKVTHAQREEVAAAVLDFFRQPQT